MTVSGTSTTLGSSADSRSCHRTARLTPAVFEDGGLFADEEVSDDPAIAFKQLTRLEQHMATTSPTSSKFYDLQVEVTARSSCSG